MKSYIRKDIVSLCMTSASNVTDQLHVLGEWVVLGHTGSYLDVC